MNANALEALVLLSLEYERGRVEIYNAALRATQFAHMGAEWAAELRQAELRVARLEQTCRELGVGAATAVSGRDVVRSLAAAMLTAIQNGIARADRSEPAAPSALLAPSTLGAAATAAPSPAASEWELRVG
jgi:hypothetical protein